MCQECGCEQPSTTITINKSLTEENDKLAHDTWHELQKQEVLGINLLGAPGSGKTTVIEGLAKVLGAENISVIQGDLESSVDKKRLEAQSIDTFQINTHSGCHLIAQMITDALQNLSLKNKKYLIIENVGNLVCPAGVKLGQYLDIITSATTEGGDKPEKYPIIFHYAKLALITKADLAKVVEFDEEKYMADVTKTNPKIKILKTSKKEPETFHAVAHFLEHEREHFLAHTHKH